MLVYHQEWSWNITIPNVLQLCCTIYRVSCSVMISTGWLVCVHPRLEASLSFAVDHIGNIVSSVSLLVYSFQHCVQGVWHHMHSRVCIPFSFCIHHIVCYGLLFKIFIRGEESRRFAGWVYSCDWLVSFREYVSLLFWHAGASTFQFHHAVFCIFLTDLLTRVQFQVHT